MALSPEEKRRRARISIENLRKAVEEQKGEDRAKERVKAQKEETSRKTTREERRRARNERKGKVEYEPFED